MFLEIIAYLVYSGFSVVGFNISGVEKDSWYIHSQE